MRTSKDLASALPYQRGTFFMCLYANRLRAWSARFASDHEGMDLFNERRIFRQVWGDAGEPEAELL